MIFAFIGGVIVGALTMFLLISRDSLDGWRCLCPIPEDLLIDLGANEKVQFEDMENHDILTIRGKV
jgi:hypothetical protein